YLPTPQVCKQVRCGHFSQVAFKVMQPKSMQCVVPFHIARCVGLFVCHVHVDDERVHSVVQLAAVVPLFDRHNVLLWIIFCKQNGFGPVGSSHSGSDTAQYGSDSRKNGTFWGTGQAASGWQAVVSTGPGT